MKNSPSTSMKMVSSLHAGGKAADADGAAVDCAGYEYATLGVVCGTLATGATGVITVEESADGSTGWTAVSGATFTMDQDADDDSVLYGQVRVDARERYLRCSLGYSGTGTLTIAGIFVLSNLDRSADVALGYQFEV